MKSQTSLEFIAIFAVIITIIAAVTLSVFQNNQTPALQQVNDRTYWATADIAIVSQQHTGDTLRLSLYNNLPRAINVTAINISDATQSQTIATELVLQSSQQSAINISHNHTTDIEGEPYELNIAFTYNDLALGTTKLFHGQAPIRGEIQS